MRTLLRQLAQDLSASKVGPKELRRLGWYEFHDTQCPDVGDLVDLIHGTIAYCCFDENGAFNGQTTFLTTLVAFMKENRDAGEVGFVVFLKLVAGGRENLDSIQFWLEQHYRN